MPFFHLRTEASELRWIAIASELEVEGRVSNARVRVA
jgi:hypothetical protein